MNAIETLISVLCDPEGKCCISGSDDDRRLIDSALAELAQAAQPAPAQEDSVQEDAARYRWLREHWFTMSSNYQCRITFKLGEPRWSDITEAELDAAIDAARKQGEKQ